ncbi:uncharacterized protein BJX67DRAFT_17116 [Aspergillus lucknowensis]|uniref:Uncharacterized protein n=1 Tax=Aspergillus lucknowensis TaxID=176173 RepID=A0ABR4M818_9EURO
MRMSTLFSLLSAVSAVVGEDYTATKLTQLQNSNTWINNLLPRGDTGYILLAERWEGAVSMFDSFHQHGGPVSLGRVNQQQSVGIVELSTNVYGVTGWSEDGGETVPIVAMYKLNLTSPQPVLDNDDYDLQAPVSGLLKGAAAINPTISFQADIAGYLLRFNWVTGENGGVYPTPSGITPGISGLGYREPYLYFSNTEEGTFNRVEVDQDGELVGEVETLVESPDLVGSGDFALSHWNEDAFVTNPELGTLLRIDLDEKTVSVVSAGTIPAPVAAKFAPWGGLLVAANVTETEGSSIWSVAVPDEPTQ